MTRHELATALEGRIIEGVQHGKAYGDMPGEWDDVTIHFADGSSLFLSAVGYDPDGIRFQLTEKLSSTRLTGDPDVPYRDDE